VQSDGRKHPAHHPTLERHNRPIIVFVSVCTKDRRKILANQTIHHWLREAWQVNTSWLVGKYIIMPDHIHFFCAPGEREAIGVAEWTKFWKSHAARFWPYASQAPVWQRECWDTQLRNHESYGDKWQYVAQNPVRAGLVQAAEEWPYQGELNILRW
jgi:putative transposase